MAEVKKQPQKISGSNTKKEMLDAYNDLINQLEEQKKSQLKPDEHIREKEKQEVVKVADSISTDEIITEVSKIKSHTGKLLSELSERLEQEVQKYNQVKKAIEEKENELKEIYEIERSAMSFAALIEAQNKKRQDFEDEMAVRESETEQELASRKTTLEQEMATINDGWEKEKEQHQRLRKEEDEAEHKKREREKEEFDYEFKREKQLTENNFRDEKEVLEKEIAEKRTQLEIEFSEREKILKEQETELNDLRKKAAAFPKELETEVNKAVKDAKERITVDMANKEELQKKGFEGERNVLNTRIASLEKSLNEQNEQITKLNAQSENALNQVQDIAVKAIEGSSNFKSFTHLQQLVTDQNRKQTGDK